MIELEEKLKKRTLVCAVVGLGYVGLPLLLYLSKLGFRTIGIDKNKKKVAKLTSNKLDFLKNNKTARILLKSYTKNKNHTISNNSKDLKDADLIFISVDTPIQKNRKPDNTNISQVCEKLAKHLKKNSIIIIESTLAPKTTQEIAIPALEKSSNLKINKDFYIAVCSERIRPNQDIFKDLTTFPRVLGTSSTKINNLVISIYKLITKGEVDAVDIVTAEIVKTTENALRDVKIAFANEISKICDSLGSSAWEVARLINKRYGYTEMLQPGIGVGGHCLPKDPWLLLSSNNHTKNSLIAQARRVNDSMPAYCAKRIAKILRESSVKNPKVLILGYSYIENCEDTRNSPSQSLVDNFKKQGVKKIAIHDPYIEECSGDLYKKAKGADCLVLAVKHDQFKNLNLLKIKKIMRTPVIFDCKNFFGKEKCQNLSFIYHAIGAL